MLQEPLPVHPAQLVPSPVYLVLQAVKSVEWVNTPIPQEL